MKLLQYLSTSSSLCNPPLSCRLICFVVLAVVGVSLGDYSGHYSSITTCPILSLPSSLPSLSPLYTSFSTHSPRRSLLSFPLKNNLFKSTVTPTAPIDIFTAGEGGYMCIRIPVVLETPKGLVAMVKSNKNKIKTFSNNHKL